MKGVCSMKYEELSLSKATIQTDKLLSNIEAFKGLLNETTQLMAVVKADAYGHGAIPLAKEIEKAQAADYLGVAQLIEAIELRDAGIQLPILVFNAVRPHEIRLAIEQDISMTIFAPDTANEIVKIASELNLQAKVHIKIDSGMGRLGISTFEEASEVYEALMSDWVEVEGIFTHFADAKEDTPDNFTHEQFKRFQIIVQSFEEEGITFAIRHCCNTAGTINFPDYHLDMVRVGLGLYGLNPTTGSNVRLELTPIQEVSARVTFVKDFPEGQSVGYGRTYYSDHPIKIATVAIGYADGVAKSLSNKGFFTYKGHRLPILGEVCMDQIMIDMSAVPDLAIGDELTYFGDPANGHQLMTDVAKFANASQYDLLCRMGRRLNRIYH